MLSTKEQIGKMDRKITIQEKIYSDNVSNERVVTGWQDIATSPEPWANVDDRFGSEVMQGDELTGLKTTNFTIRYRDDLTIENRVVFDSMYYNILDFIKIGRKGFLKIVAESGGQYRETSGGEFALLEFDNSTNNGE